MWIPKEINEELVFTLPRQDKKETGQGVAKETETMDFPHTCKKCGYEQCDVESISARYADESDIYLYRCKKCKYVERQADGSGNK